MTDNEERQAEMDELLNNGRKRKRKNRLFALAAAVIVALVGWRFRWDIVYSILPTDSPPLVNWQTLSTIVEFSIKYPEMADLSFDTHGYNSLDVNAAAFIKEGTDEARIEEIKNALWERMSSDEFLRGLYKTRCAPKFWERDYWQDMKLTVEGCIIDINLYPDAYSPDRRYYSVEIDGRDVSFVITE